jgi:hypothetical protein
MRTLWTGLLLALALIASGTLSEARACDQQAAIGSARGVVLLAPSLGQDGVCDPIPCGPVAAVPTSDDVDGGPESSDQGPERVDSDAFLTTAPGLDELSPSVLVYWSVLGTSPETPAVDRTQQPPRY